MVTYYNGFSWDIPHERQYILDIHEAILRLGGEAFAVKELYKGRDPAAVRAALVYWFGKGTIAREDGSRELDGLSDEHRIFVVAMRSETIG